MVIAFFRPTRQTRYQIGDVFGELHFVRTAGAGTVVRLFLPYMRSCQPICFSLSLRCILPSWTLLPSPPCFIASAQHGTSDIFLSTPKQKCHSFLGLLQYFFTLVYHTVAFPISIRDDVQIQSSTDMVPPKDFASPMNPV